jgi:AAA15 family ATPase/GTPase
LRFRNFKGFAEREFPFSSRFNVIVGDNGSGKSALLERRKVRFG